MKKHKCSDACYYWRNNIKHPRQLTDRQKKIVRRKLDGMGGDWYRTRLLVGSLAERFKVSMATIYRHSKNVRRRRGATKWKG